MYIRSTCLLNSSVNRECFTLNCHLAQCSFFSRKNQAGTGQSKLWGWRACPCGQWRVCPQPFHRFSSLLIICLRVELLNHMATVCLALRSSAESFSRAATPFFQPQQHRTIAAVLPRPRRHSRLSLLLPLAVFFHWPIDRFHSLTT